MNPANPVRHVTAIIRSKHFKSGIETINKTITSPTTSRIIILTIDMVITVTEVKAFAVVEDQITTDRRANHGVGFGSASYLSMFFVVIFTPSYSYNSLCGYYRILVSLFSLSLG